ncbi:MAG: right-handed parallel beta-helix repeat-containing protein [Prevotellaceae bacterium]|nr:right-handed parallel beta-helix repeat-containing protein [Prevotellaceae bacterium]
MKKLLFLLAIACVSANAKDYVVTPGNPYAIEAALQKSRMDKIHGDTTKAVIRLQSGVYRLLQSVIIRPEDNGTTIIGEQGTVISGGVKVTGWQRKGKFLVADQPEFNGRPLNFRQMWIDGKKAQRARDVDDFEKMHRILSLDKAKECIYVPAAVVKKIKNVDGLEMVLHEMWCIANLRVRSIEMLGDSAAVYFHNPESHIHFMHPWPSPMVTTDGHNSAFYLTNSKDLLDTQGEWYLDEHERKIYYLPKKGEDLNLCDVEVPAVETLVKVEGLPDNRVTDVNIQNISFEYSTWMRPSIEGHAPLQAGMYMIEAYKLRPKMERIDNHKLDNQGWVGRPSAAVVLNAAENVSFHNCRFAHTASTALDYHLYIKGGNVENCVFTDIGGSGILAGTFGPEAHEQHIAYAPTDEREVCDGLTITENLITDAANEDWGCVGIGAGWIKNICIEHNEICDVSYTGISMGWGWNRKICCMKNNTVHANLIHHYARHMYDTAGIYTLGAQPGTFITENVVRDIYSPSYVHDPNHWFYLYTDEGSSYITMQDNWTPTEKYLQNANGPDNVWQNNGTQVSEAILKNAGRTTGK